MSAAFKSSVYMLICAVLWSLSGILIKLVPWNPLVLSGWRSLIAAGVMLVYMKFVGMKFLFSGRNLAGAVTIMLMCSCYITANKLTSAANAIALQFTTPLFILVISAFLFKQKFSFFDVAAVLATTLGIGIIFFQGFNREQLIGNIIAVGAGFFASGLYFSVGSGDMEQRSSTLLMGHLLCALVGIPLSAVYTPELSFVSIAGILTLGIVQLGLSYVFLLLASKNCPPLACSLLSAIEPLLSPVWVFIGTGEAPGIRTVVGGLVIIFSVTLWNIYSNRSNSSIGTEK